MTSMSSTLRVVPPPRTPVIESAVIGTLVFILTEIPVDAFVTLNEGVRVTNAGHPIRRMSNALSNWP